MGVYIKGLEMPKTGRVVISIDAKGKIYSETRGLAFWKYAAVEIKTPHGRLIDEDALIDDLIEQKIPFNAGVNESIIMTPTILEKEE